MFIISSFCSRQTFQRFSKNTLNFSECIKINVAKNTLFSFECVKNFNVSVPNENIYLFLGLKQNDSLVLGNFILDSKTD